MASLTWWMWVWVNSGSWWWTGRPGMLRFMGLQRVGHDWATELNWYHLLKFKKIEEYRREIFFFFLKKNPYIPKDTLQISYNSLPVGEEDNGSWKWGEKELTKKIYQRKETIKSCFCTFHGALGFPGVTNGKEPASQCWRHKRHGLNPWVGTIPWRSVWQPTPVFLPGESHGQRSLEGYSPWGRRVGHD